MVTQRNFRRKPASLTVLWCCLTTNLVTANLLSAASLPVSSTVNFGTDSIASRSSRIGLVSEATSPQSMVGIDTCSLTLVESIPENLTYPAGAPRHPTIFSAWMRLLDLAKSQINIAALYWTLQGSDVYSVNTSSSIPGETILKRLVSGAAQNQFKLNLVSDVGAKNSADMLLFKTIKSVTLQWLNMNRFFNRGIEHTKFWAVDGIHGFVGSANMDWRSLTQVKETGVLIQNCPQIIKNINQIFSVYSYLSDPRNNSIPQTWPKSLMPEFNITKPLNLTLNGVQSNISISSSPRSFNPPGRDNDIDAIINGIQVAKQFVYISVMDYEPTIVNYGNKKGDRFWPVIDDALRQAALDRRVSVRLLISQWAHTYINQDIFLRSLAQLGKIDRVHLEIKYFIVPAFTDEQQKIPFSRVNHSKYMVTDKVAYVGTSNWSGDYFLYTAGVGFMVASQSPAEAGTLRQNLEEAFLRDWNSRYAHPLVV